IARLVEQGFGGSANALFLPAPTAEPNGALAPLYSVCNGLNLPDVYNGYFILPAEKVNALIAEGRLSRVADTEVFEIIPFGSDGGGNRFVLRIDDGSIYYLPHTATIKNGTYMGTRRDPPRRLTASMADFMWRLLEDVRAFVAGKDDHVYLIR